MGRVYDMQGRLCCGGCGRSGGVRRRTCTQRITYPDGYEGAGERTIPYCYAPDLCVECYKAAGGAKLHHQCRVPAADRQAKIYELHVQLSAGDLITRAAWGDWKEGVPKGMVGVFAYGVNGEGYFLLPSEAYDDRHRRHYEFLGDYLAAGYDVEEWRDYPGARSKQLLGA